MIYQLYYKNDHGVSPFGNNYTKFDLSTVVEDKYLPLIQSEYCGMLYHYYNPDNYKWIGFTSCRQIQKGYKEIVTEDVEHSLEKYDIVTWGYICHKDPRFCCSDKVYSLFDQTEFFHNGLMTLMNVAFVYFDQKNLIDIFMSYSCGIFANYWLMSKNNFNHFIDWSKPIISWMVEKPRLYNTSTGHYNTIGWIIERMFIYWYITNSKTIKVINA